MQVKTFLESTIKENEFDNYKIYEKKVVNSFLGNLLAKYQNQSIDEYSFKKICKNLETNISVVIPVYLKDC